MTPAIVKVLSGKTYHAGHGSGVSSQYEALFILLGEAESRSKPAPYA